ncbi:MAG: hypothetical protein GY798_25155 [Hyphomicrobiales bacterium]|nr:hypothetical protein [Hyphomicrobiales bacterium]
MLVAALVLPLSATGQDSPGDQLRRLFGPPAQTLKQVFTRETPPAQVLKQVFTREKPPAPTEPPDAKATGLGEAAAGAVPVPIPRQRPIARPASVPSKIAPGRFEVLPSLTPADFERRFVAAPAIGSTLPVDPAVAAETPIADEVQAFVAVPLPQPRSAAAAALSDQRFSVKPPGAQAGCTGRLKAMGIVAVPAPAIRKGRCGIAAPTAVSALGSGNIALTETAVLHCRTAEALAALMRDAAEPAAQRYLGGRLTGIRVAASYHCRTRNGVAGAKLSEHALGNAIDISAFRIDGVGWVEVGRGGPRARRFVGAVRKAACGPFTTVLGPGSDRYHSDHLHFDVAKRGKSGRSLYCK